MCHTSTSLYFVINFYYGHAVIYFHVKVESNFQDSVHVWLASVVVIMPRFLYILYEYVQRALTIFLD